MASCYGPLMILLLLAQTSRWTNGRLAGDSNRLNAEATSMQCVMDKVYDSYSDFMTNICGLYRDLTLKAIRLSEQRNLWVRHYQIKSFNSLAPGKFERNFSDWWLRHLLRNCPDMNVTGLYWWSVNIASGNGLVPSGPALYQFWDQMPPCMLIEPIMAFYGVNRLVLAADLL